MCGASARKNTRINVWKLYRPASGALGRAALRCRDGYSSQHGSFNVSTTERGRRRPTEMGRGRGEVTPELLRQVHEAREKCFVDYFSSVFHDDEARRRACRQAACARRGHFAAPRCHLQRATEFLHALSFDSCDSPVARIACGPREYVSLWAFDSRSDVALDSYAW